MLRVAKQAKNIAKNLQQTPKFNFAKKLVEDVDGIDGNYAAAYIAYACSENSFIYPITPSTPMGEHMDSFMAAGRKNIWGNLVQVDMMQSEAGAAGAVHGSLAAGSLCSTFTCSQGLLLKIPNMYLIAGELTPCVFHIAARTITKQSLSINGDHQDVMCAKSTGFAMMFCSSVQEVMDLALVCHISTIKSRVPFMCIQDGFRTSHEIDKVHVIKYEDIKKVFPFEDVEKNVRPNTVNPHKPVMRGTGQRPDIWFQTHMTNKKYHDAVPGIVEEAMKQVEGITGRPYKIFDYYGPEDPDKVVIAMGSGAHTCQETADYLNKERGYKVGVINVKLFRPWCAKRFMEALPKSCKKVAVLDRCRDDGVVGQALYNDVVSTIQQYSPEKLLVVGGVYGLSSKDFTPGMCKAVIDNLDAQTPKQDFTIGITDDVTNTSLEVKEELNTVPEETKQCIFWGLGSDGTIGANKQVIKNIINTTDLRCQGYFAYDAFKTDGTTHSSLRFGPKPFKSHYDIHHADIVSCHKNIYVEKYDMIKPLKKGGIFLLNSRWNTIEELEAHIPAKMLREIAEKEIKFYNIDAQGIAFKCGLGKRINNIMTIAWYKIANVIPFEQAEAMLKEDIVKLYGKKGEKMVKQNIDALNGAIENLFLVDYPADKWKSLPDKTVDTSAQSEFYKKVQGQILQWKGDELPVSAFDEGGYVHVSGTTKNERRRIAASVPIWIPDKCSQCNYCSIVCPHAVIRPYLLTAEELESAPKDFQARKAKGGNTLAGLNFSICISSDNCTGCEVCTKACPDEALIMKPYEETIHQNAWFDYCYNLKAKANPIDKLTVKGSQFEKPLLEFSGACAGCGETPYVKLMTQLFGRDIILANATGCSMIWGSMYPSVPYTIHQDGRGISYSHSLFEDNAEYGYGEVRAFGNRRRMFVKEVETQLLPQIESHPKLVSLYKRWVKNIKDKVASEEIFQEVSAYLKSLPESELKESKVLSRLDAYRYLITVPSFWQVGGDGWAYDIGYGGLDHILNTTDDFNIVVLDTEMYSNTGGQASKSTQMGATVKFSLGGKKTFKKDLGSLAMTYGHVYVAQVAIGADYNQCVTAFKEAESYDGPSLIVCMSPCIDWNMPHQNWMMRIQKDAVECGYWPLYRFDPRKVDQPFQLDSKKLKSELKVFIEKQLRFKKLSGNKEWVEILSKHLKRKFQKFQEMAMSDYEKLDYLKEKLGESSSASGEKALVLYGSETGNAQSVATWLANDLKNRGVPRTTLCAMDDYDFSTLEKEKNIYAVVSTAGQGDLPSNCKQFWKALTDTNIPSEHLKNAKFAVFGLGDSSYVNFNKAAKNFDMQFEKLGAKRILPIGLGNDHDEDRFETAWEDWAPNLYQEIALQAPADKLPPQNFNIKPSEAKEDAGMYVPKGSMTLKLVQNKRLTKDGYDRDVRHYIFDITGKNIQYQVGDCLAIHPRNNPTEVAELLEALSLKGDQVIEIEKTSPQATLSYPPTMTYSKLFTECLDVLGKPSRRFYEFLTIAAKDPAEKAEIKALLTKEGKSDLQALKKETTTYKDLLLKYKSAIPALPYLIDFIPPIKPRLYSIASSQAMIKDAIELCIIVNDWKTPSGKMRSGLNTTYLKNVEAGSDVAVKLHKGAISMPTFETPVVCVGLGTGIAPIRALIQDRAVAKKNGKQVGKCAFFFGARKRADEFFFQQELEQYVADGVLTTLDPAWSRDQETKVYVQDKIKSNADEVFDIIYNQKGYFYLCGSAGKIPAAAKKAIQQIIQEKAGITAEEADKFVQDMVLNGKWNLDVW